ncbi:MAG TPA: Holliday junction resolvase RuvX [Candidatus Ruania gallistercoris]|uniref:Putative pre-16S rRNA nuclease n=1 Tax=Candidatus Ruania gallistercoris TaxID=2838746 RepID=A0A9D2J698_9MICO|nr:Holliday junction resolvase RuvX [Candidatus Ruania gallistercoris]
MVPVPDLRPGVRLAIDVGSVRIGVARCDPHGVLATPVRTVSRKGPGEGLTELVELVREHTPIEVIVGLPRSLHGGEGSAALGVRAYSERLSAAIYPVPVRLVDERLTTVSAHQALHAAGRSSRQHRSVVDQVAAVMILQTALDNERNSGTPPGTALDAPQEGSNPGSEEDRR